MPPTLCLPLNSPHATLANSGGKGANLARLAQAGFPVPGGFLLTTAAYEQFVAANQLPAGISHTLAATDLSHPAGLEQASQAIRQQFQAASLPDDLAQAIRAAYQALGAPPVAVRSSATAEDLPDTSFAGQQDTYLNVIGESALLDAVVRCWASLWTARAIGYRARNAIPHQQVAMAVVVQAMVNSDLSGVLFTANPLSGRRSETVIDATLGLGEALVSGQVEPDQYVVDSQTGRVKQQQIGAKALVIRPRPGGGTTSHDTPHAEPALNQALLARLTQLGQQVAGEFGTPQDIEWATAGDTLYLLQARPITSLFPIPQADHNGRLGVYLSFGAVQGMLDPMTPFGQEMIQGIFAASGQVMGFKTSLAEQRVFLPAAERLWANLTPLFHSRPGQKLLGSVAALVEPQSGQAISQVLAEHAAGETAELRPGWPRPGTLWRLLRFFLPLLARILYTILRPAGRAERNHRRAEARFTAVANQLTQATTLAGQINALPAVWQIFLPLLAEELVPLLGGGMAPLTLLNRLARDLPNGPQLVLTITRGLPHNVTTEMDLALWETARQIQADPAGQAQFQSQSATDLANACLAGTLPPASQQAIAHFLARYGMRGLAEIDIGRARWREEPAQLMHVLQSYLAITDPAQAPDAVFARGAQAAAAATAELAAALRQAGGLRGRLKARLVPPAARRVREFAGFRESPKFYIVRLLGLARAALLASGAELTAAGLLARPEDIFFLRVAELTALAGGQSGDWRALVAQRQQRYATEQRRRLVPRLLLSDGQAFYEGTAAGPAGETTALSGTPVSPGVAEGAVHVVLDPRGVQLAPGEILVCPGTDPAWTPLFLAAGGLITEVGGLMTHGSVVAREYGIPAVVGVPQATTRLHTGQRIRLDGSTGQIALLGPEHDEQI